MDEEDGTACTTPLLEDPEVEAESQQPPRMGLLPPSMSNLDSITRKEEAAAFQSHFTLRIPTSTVHFRGNILRIIDTEQEQIILQQKIPTDDDGGMDSKKAKVVVKRLSPGTYGYRMLRVGYALIAILFMGFLFVVCFQILLFLFAALPVEAGYSSSQSSVSGLAIVSTLLSIPLMIYGMSSLMSLCSAFVVDAFHGGALFRSTIVEVMYMMVFLVIPMTTFAVALMAGHAESWRLTSGVWGILVLILFCVWGLAVTYREVYSCFWLVEKHYFQGCDVQLLTSPSSGANLSWREKMRHLMKIAKKALLLTQTSRYAGIWRERYQVTASSDAGLLNMDPVEQRKSIYSWISRISVFTDKLKFFKVLEVPKRVYGPSEVRDIIPFVTRDNWSMQRLWCAGDTRLHSVVVARGPSRLTLDQIKLSSWVSLASTLLATLLAFGGLVWSGGGVTVSIIVAVLAVFCCIWPLIGNNRRMLDMYEGVRSDTNQSDDDERGANTIYQVWKTVRVTEPTEYYCYFRVAVEIIFLFLWPFVSMCVANNTPVAIIFVFLASFTFLWRYFDSMVVLSLLGTIEDVGDETTTHEDKYRLSEVVGRVINNKGRRIWTWIFAIFFLLILFMFTSAEDLSTDVITPDERAATRPPILMLDDFEYPGSGGLQYPTCTLSQPGFTFPTSGETESRGTYFLDYAFLSAMAYESSAITNYTLDTWFGPNVMKDEVDFVGKWREDSGTFLSPVQFKLFSLTNHPGFAVVSIRGSETMWDWIQNLQLWSAAGLSQMVKWIIPYGWIFNPILPDFIQAVNLIESKKISEVSYYKVTTRFVNEVTAGYSNEYGGGNFGNLKVTGASLGGGLAIITGAQTSAYTVAISGPGATLSRRVYDPPITTDALNTQVFNFIPERDYIARLGGRADLFQNAQCLAPKNDLFGCHSMWRSVCELNYKCGSNGRPVFCRCVESFGYPEPTALGNRTFAQACQDASTAWFEMFPQK